MWNGARGSEDSGFIPSPSKVRKVAGSGRGDAKCGRSHLETVSSPGTLGRSRNPRETGLGGGVEKAGVRGGWRDKEQLGRGSRAGLGR